MLYHGFYVKITPMQNVQREHKDGSIVMCDGFQIGIFSDSTEMIPVDFFTAAVGFEIVNDSVRDAKQFAEDVIDCEEKEYLRLIEEFADGCD